MELYDIDIKTFTEEKDNIKNWTDLEMRMVEAGLKNDTEFYDKYDLYIDICKKFIKEAKELKRSERFTKLEIYKSLYDARLNQLSRFTTMTKTTADKYKELLEFTDKDTCADVLIYGNPLNPYYEHIPYLKNNSISDIKKGINSWGTYNDDFRTFNLEKLYEALKLYEEQTLKQLFISPTKEGNMFKENNKTKQFLADTTKDEFYDILCEDFYLLGNLIGLERKLLVGPDETDFGDIIRERFVDTIANYTTLDDFETQRYYYGREAITQNAIKRLIR